MANSDPMALVSAGTAEGAAGALRQLLVDRIAAQERARLALVQDRDFNLRQQEFDQRTQEHNANMQSLAEQRTAQAADNRLKLAQGVGAAHGIGDPLSTDTVDTLTAGGLGDLTQHQDARLPSRVITGMLSLPDANAPMTGAASVTQQPGNPEQTVWGGTDKQRTDAEQKRIRGRLVANPNISPRERLAIEMENAGLKVPTGVFDPKPVTTSDGNYTLNGRPIVGLKTNGRVMYRGQDVTDQVTPPTHRRSSRSLYRPGPARSSSIAAPGRRDRSKTAMATTSPGSRKASPNASGKRRSRSRIWTPRCRRRIGCRTS